MIHRAQVLAHEHGLGLSASKISRIIRRHSLASNATDARLVRCLRTYADRTGDRAVAAVMGEWRPGDYY